MYKMHNFPVSRFVNPSSFFTGGKNGFWLDLDPSTWYEDSAMTTLATFGNPIGAWRDKSGNGINALQSTSGSRPTYGRMPYGGVRNRGIYTEDFSNAAWSKLNCTLLAGVITTTSTADGLTQAVSTYSANNTNSITFRVAQGTSTWMRLVCYQTASSANRNTCWFNLSTGAAGSATNGGTGTGATITMSEVSAGIYDITLTGAVNNSATAVTVQISTAAADLSTTGVSGVTYSPIRYQPEIGSSPTAYQKVVAGWDVTESGVASVACPWFDGVDDFLDFTSTGGAALARDVGRFIVCGTANMTSTISTFRSMMRLSTAGANTNPRAMLGGTATGNLSAQGRRLDADATETVSIAQNTFTNIVTTADFKYSAAELYLRRNGAVVASDLTFQTAGNTEDTDSFACYIGRNVTNYYGGFFPSLFAIADTALSDAQLLQLETYMAQQIGGTGL